MTDRIPEVLIKFTGKPITPEYIAEIRARLIEAQRTGRVDVIPLEPLSTGYGPLIPWRRTMIPFIRKYAVEIVAAIGYITSIATALGLSRQHYVSIVLGVLSTIGIILTKYFTITKPAKAASVADRRPASSV